MKTEISPAQDERTGRPEQAIVRSVGKSQHSQPTRNQGGRGA